jgi:hypothetical protein
MGVVMSDDEKDRTIKGVADSKGQFQTHVPAGHVTVIASADGYSLQVQRTEVKAGRKEVTLKLYPQRARQVKRALPPLLKAVPWAPLWEPQPALVIGLGGTGRHVLTHLKKNLLDAGAGKLTDAVRLVLFDTSDYELLEGQRVPVSFAGVSLEPQDIVEIGENLSSVVETLEKGLGAEAELRGWFPSSYYKHNIAPDELNLEHGTRQRRPLSRALLVRDIRKGIATKGVRAVLMFDSASSMRNSFPQGSESISKFEAVKRSMTHFVDQMDFSLDHVAVVQFDKSARTIHPLGQDGRSIKKAIFDSRVGDAERSFSDALVQARQLLDKKTDVPGVIVLFSDDQNTLKSALETGMLLQQEGIRLIIVGLGDIDSELLRRISESSGKEHKFFHTPSASDLTHITVRIARDLGEGSRVWRLLHGGARAAMDDVDGLRVILIGSLAGGFGSAILADIAYLARRAGAAVGAKSTSVEAYLATDGVFSQVSPNLDKNAVNTFAALRELERFQIAQGYPFRMIYRADAVGDPVLAGSIDWRLLDEVYLYDSLPAALPSHPSQESDWYKPTATVFPAMADIITLWLDKAARSGGSLSQYRRGVQGDVTREQSARGRAVMGGFGIHVYRLPMYDVLELLKARWVRHLLHRFLAEHTPNLPESNPNLSGSAGLLEDVYLFLIGAAGYEEPACPPAIQMAGFLAFEGLYDELEVQIKNTTFAESFEQDAHAYRAYLNGALLMQLNRIGNAQQQTMEEKPSYLFLFLDEIKRAWKRAQENLNGEHPALNELINTYIHETGKARLEIEEQLELLDPRSMGLYRIIESLETDCRKRLEELKTVLPRHYLYVHDYLDKWYETYFNDAPFQNESLERLHWVEDETNRIGFALRSWDNHLLRVGKASQYQFVTELLNMAGQVGRNMIKGETLDAILSETVLQTDRFEETMHNLEVGAQPMLRFEGTKASQAKRRLELGVNPAVTRDRDILNRLRRGVSAEQMIQKTDITDPYTLYLAQMIDVVPLEAMTALNFTAQTYRRWYGLEMGVPPDLHSEPQAVFRAEAVALAFEQRLIPELRQTPRFFSPIIISALDAEEACRLFALALAAGWVHKIGAQTKISLGGPELWSLVTPQGINLHPLVIGFVRFATQAGTAELEALKSAVAGANEDIVSVWRGWTTPAWQKQEIVQELSASGTEGLDLASVTALVVRDELRRRMASR